MNDGQTDHEGLTRRALLAAALSAALLPMTVPASGAQPAGPDAPRIDPEVRSRAQAGPVRVLVELRVDAADPAAIARVQEAVLARLPREHATVARRYASVPLLALEIDQAALPALEAMTDTVAAVKLDGLARPQ